MAAVRNTKQREAIKKYLMSTVLHPTAETVYEEMRQQFPNISLGTVYRNLNFLVENGEAQVLRCGDGYDHYDANTSPHNHFFCSRCGRLLDLDMDGIDFIDKIAAAGFDGRIEGHNIYFYGICPDCIEKRQNTC